ncbi:MAG: PAS domain S-box protein [Pyrinomonadaceae bacterium]
MTDNSTSDRSDKAKVFKDIAIIFALGVIVFALVFVFDVFSIIQSWSPIHRENIIHIDELIALLVFPAIAFGLFFLRRWRDLKGDVAERRQIEDALRRSERDYRELFEQAHDAIIILTPEDETILDVNQRACDVYGFSRAEFIGMSLKEISRNPNRGERKIEETLAAGTYLNFETVQCRKDATEMLLEINAAVINYKGRRAILSINRDVTKRKQGEEALRKAKSGLEIKVAERTSQLRDANAHLQRELAERRRIEEALRESEKRYRQIVESADHLICKTDADGYFTFVNHTFKRMLKYPSESLPGLHYLDVIHPDYRAAVAKFYIRQRLKKIPSTYYEFPVIAEDGESFWLGQNVQMIVEEDRIAGFQSLARDITARKQAEDELLVAKERLQQLLSSSPAVLYSFKAAGDFGPSFISENVFAQLGYEAAEFINDPGFWVDRIHPEDRPAVLAGYPNLFEQGHTLGEYRFLHRDGGYRWIRDELKMVRDADGTPLELVGYWIDITERKQAEEKLRKAHDELEQRVQARTLQLARTNDTLRFEINERKQTEASLMESEERFRQIAENIQEVFWMSEPDKTRIIYISPGYEKIWGRTCESLYASPRSWLETIYPDDRERVSEAAMTKQLQGSYDEEYRIVRPDGTIQWIHDRAFPVHDESGRVYRIAGIADDITQRKEVEANINASLHEKEVLLKEIHHRVKNNLQVISSLLSLQSKNIRDERALAVLKESGNRVRSMALIHEKLYRSENLAKIDFAAYVRNLTANLFRSYGVNADTVRLRIEIENILLGIDMALPCGLIINELVSNSLKYAFPADREGEVCVGLYTPRRNEFVLTVGDNGVGFPPDVNYRNAESLGLQLVNTLTDQLNGALELRNGVGTAFEIRFTESVNEGAS